VRVAILGPGNVGADLLEKLRRSPSLEVSLVAGLAATSPGLMRAAAYGIATSTRGLETILESADRLAVVFDATTAAAHAESASQLAGAGIRVIDLTPSGVGLVALPALDHWPTVEQRDVSLATCGAQAAAPLVAGVAAVSDVEYAEVVSTLPSISVGRGMRCDVDEVTQITAVALERVGGARRAKAIVIVNPADPPAAMRNSVACLVDVEADADAIAESLRLTIAKVRLLVPGYRLVTGPLFEQTDDGRLRVAVVIEVTGRGDFLPPYAGNLDLTTVAAVAVAERLAVPQEVLAR
jgi:acetaldehyde dehydrogenase